MILCVSIISLHKVGNRIKRLRKCLHKKITYHVDKIWGEKCAVKIYISTLIDDYSNLMGVEGVPNQRVSYCHPFIFSLQENNLYLCAIVEYYEE